MMYLLAIILPPVAVLMSGKPIQAVLNFFLCLLFWIPGVIHAILVVNEKKSDNRMKKQVKMQAQLSEADRKDMERQFAKQNKGL